MRHITTNEMEKAVEAEYNKGIRELAGRFTPEDKSDLEYLNTILNQFTVYPIPPEATDKPADRNTGIPIARPNGIVGYIRHNYTNYQEIMDLVNIHAAPEVVTKYDDRMKRMVTRKLTPNQRAAMKLGSKYAQLKLHKYAGKKIVEAIRKTGQIIAVQ
jgi:hypothetical protein